MAHGAAMVVMGMPLTSTKGLGTVGMAMPPCEHITTDPTVRMGPGMVCSFLLRFVLRG
jgi:hypothetical protein